MAQSAHSPSREVKLFRNNRSQAIRIPAEFALPGDRVRISREGDRLIIEPIPVESTGLLALIKTWDPLDEDFPDIDEDVRTPKDVSL